LNLQPFISQVFNDLLASSWYELLAVLSGILSVWFYKKENILVYPVGLVNTVIYVFISLKGHLPGEAAVNIYYTAMSLLGWYQWGRKDASRNAVLPLSRSSGREWRFHLLFFSACFILIFFALSWFRQFFFEGAIPWADALASAAAFTGMWLMTQKKLESWYWWILTNLLSIPLYIVKHYALSGAYYAVLLVLSFYGLAEWKRKIKQA
jgi:nicotinamide mononucleotide transporter